MMFIQALDAAQIDFHRERFRIFRARKTRIKKVDSRNRK